MTFQSMPDSSEKNACSASVAPMSSISAAPPSAAATRWIFSVAISDVGDGEDRHRQPRRWRSRAEHPVQQRVAA